MNLNRTVMRQTGLTYVTKTTRHMIWRYRLSCDSSMAKHVLISCRSSSADPFRVPDYRRHKFSDSHSSLASLATSRSEAHSRISSVTTINEIPSIDSVLSEVPQADASSPGLPASSPTQAERKSRFKPQDASLSPRGRSRTGFIVPRITRAASPSDVALNLKQGGIVKPPTSATMST